MNKWDRWRQEAGVLERMGPPRVVDQWVIDNVFNRGGMTFEEFLTGAERYAREHKRFEAVGLLEAE